VGRISVEFERKTVPQLFSSIPPSRRGGREFADREVDKESAMTTRRKPDGTTHGGQELPDELQDRPEQNAGYDAAVNGGENFAPTLDEDTVPAPDNDQTKSKDLDDEAARSAAAAVRRRERSAH
jgi:hypothetical protein